MAITIADYSYRQLITGTAPASSLSGFVALITADNVNSTFFDNADNGGGDIRVCLNVDGTSQLPLQVEVCNTSTDKLYAWVRFPTYSTAAREVYIFAGNSGQTQPAVTATYGRNNVWQDYKTVNHGRDLVNSTGGPNFTAFGSSPVAISQKHGAGWNFTGVTGMLFSPVTGSSDIPVYTLEYYGGFPNNTVGSSPEMGGVSLARQIERGGFDFSLYGNQTPSGGTNTASVRQWQPENNVNDNLGETGNYYGGGGFFSSSRAAVISENPYLYGIGDSGGDTQEGNSNSIQGTSAGRAVDTFGIGGRADNSETYFDNVVVEARLALNVIPINQRKHNALNYNDPATFWTQSTPDDPSGGAVTEYDLILSQGVYSLTGQPVDLLTERSISLGQGSYSTTGAIFTFDYVVPSNYNFLLNAGTYSTTGQDITLLTERSVTLSQGSYSTTGNDIGLTTERAISLDQGSYDITGQPVSLLANRSLSLDQGNYDITGQPVNLLADRVLDLQQGSYTITGRSITFRYIETNAYNLVLGQGSYSTIGSDFTFDYVVPNQYNITLASGSYSTTGDEVSLLVERMLTMGTGSYSSEGLPITALFHRQLTMNAGVYTTVGSSVSIAYSEFSGFEIGSYSISFVQTPVQAYYDDLLVNTTYKH